MAKQLINIGTSANKGDGDPLRTAFSKINDNFNELYDTNFADPGALESSIIPGTNATYDLGSNTNRWSDLHVNDFIYLNGQRVEVTSGGAILVNGSAAREVKDTVGSVFGDDSTLLVDGVNSSINLDGTVKGNIIPDTDVAYDLGSATNRFRDLYLSGSTIDLGGTTLSVVGGELLLGGVKVPTQTDLDNSFSTPTLDKIEVSSFDTNTTLLSNVLTVGADSVGSQMSFGRNSFAIQQFQDPEGESNKLYSQLQLSGGVARLLGRIETLDNLDQPTEHFGTVNAEAGRVTVQAYTGGTAVEWMFDESGITFPDATVQTTAWTGSISSLDGDVTGSVFADDSTLLVDGVNGKIVAPININDNEIFDGAGDTGLNIRSNQTDGNIYLYSYGSDGDGTGAGNIYVKSNAVEIYSDWQNGGAGEKKWTFGGNGSLTFPDATVQTTAWTGSAFDQDLNTTDNPQFNRVGLTAGEINVTAGTDFNLYVTPDGETVHSLTLDTNGLLTLSGGLSTNQYGITIRGAGVYTLEETDGGVVLGSQYDAYISTQNSDPSPTPGNEAWYWAFRQDGSLTLPGSGAVLGWGGINDSNSLNINIPETTDSNVTHQFAFDASYGFPALRFPDGTFQTTALKAETVAQTGYRLQFDTDIYANETGGATDANETGVQFASNTVVRELFDLTPPATSTAARVYVDPEATEFQPDPNILEVTIVSGAPLSVGMSVYAIVDGTAVLLGYIDSQTDATTFRLQGAPLTEEVPIGTEFEFYGPGNFIEYAPINPITISWDSGEETVVTAGSTNSPYGVNVFLVTAENQTALTYPIEVVTDNYAPAEFSHIIDADNDFKITTRANDFVINANEGPLIFRNATSGDAIYDQGGSFTIPSFFNGEGLTISNTGVIATAVYDGDSTTYLTLDTEFGKGLSVHTVSSDGNNNYIWKFGPDGTLTVPGEISAGRITSDSSLTLEAATIMRIDSTGGGDVRLGTVHAGQSIKVGSSTTQTIINGNLDLSNANIAGDIRSEGNINIDINLSDSTLRRWSFGEDGNLNLAGNLTFSDGTVQTTATPTELTPFIRSGVIQSGTSFTAYGITIAMSGSNPYTITATASLTVGGDSYISSPGYTGGIFTTPQNIFTITGAGQSCTAIISDLNTFAMYRVTVQNMVVNDPAYELTMVAIEQMRSTAYSSGSPI